MLIFSLLIGRNLFSHFFPFECRKKFFCWNSSITYFNLLGGRHCVSYLIQADSRHVLVSVQLRPSSPPPDPSIASSQPAQSAWRFFPSPCSGRARGRAARGGWGSAHSPTLRLLLGAGARPTAPLVGRDCPRPVCHLPPHSPDRQYVFPPSACTSGQRPADYPSACARPRLKRALFPVGGARGREEGVSVEG